MSHFFLPFSSDSLDRLSADGIKTNTALTCLRARAGFGVSSGPCCVNAIEEVRAS